MNKLHNITKLSSTLIFIATIFASSHAYAETATLNGVEISSSKNSRGYDIVLNTDTQATVQKNASTNDNLQLNLKNTKADKNINTVYKNANGIEHVILKPEANDLKIEINGEEAGNSNVKLNNDVASEDLNNTVFINRPLNSYRPVKEDVAEETSGISIISLMKKIINSPSLNNLLHSPSLGWMVCIILMLGFFAMSNTKTRKTSSVNLTVSDTVEDKENTLLKELLTKNSGLIAEGAGVQRNTQIRPKTQPQNQPTMQKTNYGLRAYNNQSDGINRKSFNSNSMPMPKDIFNTPITEEQPVAIPQRPVLARPAAPVLTTRAELKESTKKNEVQIDNVKFLESMAKIYEKSGRVDLANGLANNIKKARSLR